MKKISENTLEVLQAYLECSNGIKEVVRRMLVIVSDKKSDKDEKKMALATISEALFPPKPLAKKKSTKEERLEAAIREYCRQVDLSDSYSGVPSGAYEKILRDSYKAFAKELESEE